MQNIFTQTSAFQKAQQAFYATNPLLYVMEKHKNQKRKYTGAPYLVHLVEVAGIATSSAMADLSIDTDHAHLINTVALLHDVIEDKHATEEEITQLFGGAICALVMQLTDTEEGNREARKKASAERIGKAHPVAQYVKLADIMSNTIDIHLHDKKFAVQYLKEKVEMLKHIEANNRIVYGTKIVNTTLFQVVKNQVLQLQESLNA